MKLIVGYISLGGFALVFALLPLLIMGCANEADKSFREAQILYDQENYDGVIAKYNEALEVSTKDSVKERALYLIGWTYYNKLKNYEQALSTFQELIDKFPENDYLEEAMFKTAYCLGQVGQADEALKQYEALVNRFPESQSEYFTLAYFNQGATYSRQQNYEAALENYELSLKSTQDLNRQAEIQLRIGRIYHSQENYQNSITTFENAIATSENAITTFELESKDDSKSDDIAEAKLNLANAKVGIAGVYFAMESWEDAIAGYKRVLDEHSENKRYALPKSSDPLSKSSYWIGKTYYKLSAKSTETDRENNEAPEISDNLDIQAIIAGLENPDNFNKALNWYQKTHEDFPDSRFDLSIAIDLREMWEVSYKQQNYRNAQLVLQKLLDLFPEGLDVILVESGLYQIGLENHSQQNYQPALQAFEDLVTNFPQSKYIAYVRYFTGDANYHLQNYENARKALHEFLTQTPDLNLKDAAQAQLLIAQSYLDQKNYDQAYLNFDKLTTEMFRDSGKRAEAMYKAAYCLKQLKVNDEALGRYAEFMTRFSDSKYITDAYFDLGSLYADNKKDYELARFNYNRALQSPESQNHSKAEIQLQIGHTYYNHGNFEKASNVYSLLLQEYPESEQVLMAKLLIAYIHRRAKRTDEAIRACESIIADYTEKKPVYFSYYMDDRFLLSSNLIALSYYEISQVFSAKNDFERALSSYARIVKKPDGEEVDFRKDPIAPFALHDAMVALCKLGRKDELETFATTYINALGDIKVLSDDELILSAEAQLKFADVLREELKDYSNASAEYAKLRKYPPIQQLRLELIKLRGKYYEGQCYEKVPILDKSVEAYQEAIRLFDSIFRPLVDNPNIDVPRITEAERDYFITTARYYAGNSYFATNQFEKVIVEFEEFLKRAEPENQKFEKFEPEKFKEMIKTARDKIEKARRKLGAKTEGSPKSSSNASEKSDSSVKPETENNLTPDQTLAQKASESTVLLTMKYADPEKTGTGTGFFVRSDLIATNYHVIEGALGGTARLVGGTKMSYAIVGYTAVDPDRDLAILKVRAFGVEPLRLGNSGNIKVNDDVYAVGNPLGESYLEGTVSYGKISGLREDPTGKWIQMTAPITHGNSGGPVLNKKAEVIGISTIIISDDTVKISYDVRNNKNEKIGSVELPRRREQNLNFARHVDHLSSLLNRVGWTSPPKPLSDLER